MCVCVGGGGGGGGGGELVEDTHLLRNCLASSSHLMKHNVPINSFLSSRDNTRLVGTPGQIRNTRNRPAGAIYMNNRTALVGQEQWIKNLRHILHS